MVVLSQPHRQNDDASIRCNDHFKSISSSNEIEENGGGGSFKSENVQFISVINDIRILYINH